MAILKTTKKEFTIVLVLQMSKIVAIHHGLAAEKMNSLVLGQLWLHELLVYQTLGYAMVMLIARIDLMSQTHARLKLVVEAILDAIIRSVYLKLGLAVRSKYYQTMF